MTIRTVHMDFLYGGAFRTGLPEAYERLILDAMLGDATLFTRIDEVEEQWALVDAIVAAWARDRPAFPNYAAGTWGPTRGRRADGTRRAGMAAALASGPGDRARGGRARASRRATDVPLPADECHDAHGVGSARVGRGGRRRPGRARRTPSVADDRARSRARRRGRARGAMSTSRSSRQARGARSAPRRSESSSRGARASAPASVVQPLFLPDLPVFLRWRGVPSFGSDAFESLVGVVDRLIVDSTEWPELPETYARLDRRLRPCRRLGHRVGADEPLAQAARVPLARDPERGAAPRHRDCSAGAAARRLAELAPRPPRAAGARACRHARVGRDRRQVGALPSGRSAGPVRPAFRAARPVRARPVYEEAVRSAAK